MPDLTPAEQYALDSARALTGRFQAIGYYLAADLIATIDRLTGRPPDPPVCTEPVFAPRGPRTAPTP